MNNQSFNNNLFNLSKKSVLQNMNSKYSHKLLGYTKILSNDISEKLLNTIKYNGSNVVGEYGDLYVIKITNIETQKFNIIPIYESKLTSNINLNKITRLDLITTTLQNIFDTNYEIKVIHFEKSCINDINDFLETTNIDNPEQFEGFLKSVLEKRLKEIDNQAIKHNMLNKDSKFHTPKTIDSVKVVETLYGLLPVIYLDYVEETEEETDEETEEETEEETNEDHEGVYHLEKTDPLYKILDQLEETDEEHEEINQLEETDQSFKEIDQLLKESEQLLKESDQLFEETEQSFKNSDQLLKDSDQLLKDSDQLLKDSDQLLKKYNQLLKTTVSIG